MKTLNQFRATNKFCVTGGIVRHFAEIGSWASANGLSIVAVAGDEKSIGDFTVRAILKSDGSITDYQLNVVCGVYVKDTQLIHSGRAA